MTVWKFQFLPHTRDVVARGYRMDTIGRSVEQEVNNALPYRFRFHGISKLVLVLGPGNTHQEIYEESLGVALKVVPTFALLEYANAEDLRKLAMLHHTIATEFGWFGQNFEDAGFIAKACKNLNWAAPNQMK